MMNIEGRLRSGATLEVRRERPPNYGAVVAVFPAARLEGTIFCYAPAIYIPLGSADVHPATMAHEVVHAQRQGANPVGWWDRYLIDPQFRLDEELVAHQAEYRWYAGYPYEKRRNALAFIAARLAGPLYNRMLTVKEAKRLITGRDDVA